MTSCLWIIVTGGGTGIGRAIVKHFSETHRILTCGRRLEPLQETKASSCNPSNVQIVQADIAQDSDRQKLIARLPSDAGVALLVQNAAIGDPDRLPDVDLAHLEHALQVNLIAPLALTQALLPALVRGKGRILHLGTSVAHNPQEGSLTYGVTKMAFHRLYRQINAEPGLGVPCGSLSPGMVDTEGVVDHVAKARAVGLPHVKYFDEAYEKGWLTPESNLMLMMEHLMKLSPQEFSSKEWKYSEWAKRPSSDPNPSFGSTSESKSGI